MARNDARGPVRSEGQTKQGGRSRLTLWVLVASLVLAGIVGVMLMTGTYEVPPSEPRSAAEPSPGPAAPPRDTTTKQ